MFGGEHMANIRSAMKRIKTTEKRTLRNKSRKTELKTLSRKFETFLAAGDTENASAVLRDDGTAVSESHTAKDPYGRSVRAKKSGAFSL